MDSRYLAGEEWTHWGESYSPRQFILETHDCKHPIEFEGTIIKISRGEGMWILYDGEYDHKLRFCPWCGDRLYGQSL